MNIIKKYHAKIIRLSKSTFLFSKRAISTAVRALVHWRFVFTRRSAGRAILASVWRKIDSTCALCKVWDSFYAGKLSWPCPRNAWGRILSVLFFSEGRNLLRLWCWLRMTMRRGNLSLFLLRLRALSMQRRKIRWDAQRHHVRVILKTKERVFLSILLRVLDSLIFMSRVGKYLFLIACFSQNETFGKRAFELCMYMCVCPSVFQAVGYISSDQHDLAIKGQAFWPPWKLFIKALS